MTKFLPISLIECQMLTPTKITPQKIAETQSLFVEQDEIEQT